MSTVKLAAAAVRLATIAPSATVKQAAIRQALVAIDAKFREDRQRKVAAVAGAFSRRLSDLLAETDGQSQGPQHLGLNVKRAAGRKKPPAVGIIEGIINAIKRRPLRSGAGALGTGAVGYGGLNAYNTSSLNQDNAYIDAVQRVTAGGKPIYLSPQALQAYTRPKGWFESRGAYELSRMQALAKEAPAVRAVWGPEGLRYAPVGDQYSPPPRAYQQRTYERDLAADQFGAGVNDTINRAQAAERARWAQRAPARQAPPAGGGVVPPAGSRQTVQGLKNNLNQSATKSSF